MNPLKIVFAGTPEFTIPSLDAIHKSHHKLLAVYTQPDRPAGRGRKLQASAVKTWALEHELPIHQPLTFKDPKAIETLSSLNPDLMVVIAYGLILPQAVLDIPKLGCVNVHGSLLPRWRGASPIQQAVLHGDKETGITIMQMDAGMDTGDMLNKVTYTLDAKDTSGSVYEKLAKLAANPLLKTLDELAAGHAKPQSQDERFVTYAPKINKEEAAINWNEHAEVIDCKIRGYHPWPVAYTQVGEMIFKIHQASLVSETYAQSPGTIVSIDKKGIMVATPKGSIRIERIQFPGSKIVSVADFLNANSQRLLPGLILQ